MKKFFILIFLLIQIYSLNKKEKINQKKFLNKEIVPNSQNETDNQGNGFFESIDFDTSDALDFVENIIKLPFKLIKDFNQKMSNQNNSALDMIRHV